MHYPATGTRRTVKAPIPYTELDPATELAESREVPPRGAEHDLLPAPDDEAPPAAAIPWSTITEVVAGAIAEATGVVLDELVGRGAPQPLQRMGDVTVAAGETEAVLIFGPVPVSTVWEITHLHLYSGEDATMAVYLDTETAGAWRAIDGAAVTAGLPGVSLHTPVWVREGQRLVVHATDATAAAVVAAGVFGRIHSA